MGYGPFGTLVVRKGTTSTPYLYGGRFGAETDPSGLLYMRARYYHPLLRRFLSPDPIGFAGGLNWYVYAGNDPYQFGDPTGLGKDTVPEGGLLTRLQGGACGSRGGSDAGERAGRADGGGCGQAPRVIVRQPGRLGDGGRDRPDGSARNWVSSPTASTCIQACWGLWSSG